MRSVARTTGYRNPSAVTTCLAAVALFLGGCSDQVSVEERVGTADAPIYRGAVDSDNLYSGVVRLAITDGAPRMCAAAS